jgi:hypothetical protein
MGRSELLFILFLEILEFWRIYILKRNKIKMLHDEFLYDESLNSYHNHIYMLVRIGKLSLIFTTCEH